MSVQSEIVRLKRSDFAAYLWQYAQLHNGWFKATLVKENGQNYNLVLHPGGLQDKTRLYLEGGSTFEVRDIIEQLFTPAGQFPPVLEPTIDRTIAGSLGCVLLKIENGFVVGAYFHEGEIMP